MNCDRYEKVVLIRVVLSIVANLAVNQITTNQNSILDGASQNMFRFLGYAPYLFSIYVVEGNSDYS